MVFLALIGAAQGCCLFPSSVRPPPPPGDVEEEVPVVEDRYPFGKIRARPGEWVRYRIGDSEVRLTLVEESAEGWIVEIEKKAEDRVEKMRQKIGGDGRVIESQWIGKNGVVKQRIVPAPDPARRPEFTRAVAGTREIDVGGRRLQVTRVELSVVDRSGEVRRVSIDFSAQVPGLVTEWGGESLEDRQALVRFHADSVKEGADMELEDWGGPGR